MCIDKWANYIYQTNKEKLKDSYSLLEEGEEYQGIVAITLPENLSFLKKGKDQTISSQPLNSHSDNPPKDINKNHIPRSSDKHHHHHVEDLNNKKPDINTISRG